MKSNDETKCGEADRNRLQSIVSLLIGLFQNTEVIMLMATSMLVTGIGDETRWDNFGCWLWIKYISKITNIIKKVATIMILSSTVPGRLVIPTISQRTRSKWNHRFVRDGRKLILAG